MTRWRWLAAAGLLATLAITLWTPTPWLAAEALAARVVSPDPARASHALRVARVPAARMFWGVATIGDPEAACADLQRAAAALAPGAAPDLGPTASLLRYLEDGHPPSQSGSPFWLATTPTLERLERRLRASAAPVGPGTLLAIAAEEAASAPLGVLAAHNLAKELTLGGRRHAPESLPGGVVQLAASLAPWRREPRLPSGGFDRVGPLYHALAAMTLVVWTGSAALGRLAADYEAARRTLSWSRDRPDPEKARADRCGVEAGARLLRPVG